MAETGEQASPDEVEDTQKGKFLTFCLGTEFYGIEIKYVTEIIGLQPITEIPEMPKYISELIRGGQD